MTIFDDRRELLDAFRAGSREALTEVYRHYFGDVSAGVCRGVFLAAEGQKQLPGVREAAIQDELIQDIFVRAFSERARLSFDGLRPYGPYIRRIARNRLADHWRRHGREVPVEEIEQLVEARSPVEPELPAEEAYHRETLREATRAYLGSLAAEQRRYVELRFEDGLGQREVATRLGWTRWRARRTEDRVQDGLLRELKRLKLLD